MWDFRITGFNKFYKNHFLPAGLFKIFNLFYLKLTGLKSVKQCFYTQHYAETDPDFMFCDA